MKYFSFLIIFSLLAISCNRSTTPVPVRKQQIDPNTAPKDPESDQDILGEENGDSIQKKDGQTPDQDSDRESPIFSGKTLKLSVEVDNDDLVIEWNPSEDRHINGTEPIAKQ